MSIRIKTTITRVGARHQLSAYKELEHCIEQRKYTQSRVNEETARVDAARAELARATARLEAELTAARERLSKREERLTKLQSDERRLRGLVEMARGEDRAEARVELDKARIEAARLEAQLGE